MKNLLSIALTAISLCLMPKANSAQAPDLGTTSGFALFTAIGAFNNVGASIVTGDVGTNVGAFTGFPPGNLNGQIHAADPASVQAAIDVAVAFASMSSINCGLVLGTTLGNGQLLNPNVYCLAAASTLNGNLILDAQGDPDALFIFKINGAFAAATHTNVTLINAASLCNVYWQVNGEFILGDSSIFTGTVLANGAITLNTGATLNGRGLSQAGAINTSAVYVNVANCCTLNIRTKKEICPNDSTGKLTAVAYGSGPFTYLWNNGTTNKSVKYYAKGTYTVTVTDNGINGCGVMTKSKPVFPLRKIIFLQSRTDITCITCCDGALFNAYSTGGTPPYTYLWSDGNTNANRNDFCKGIYSLTITDANGCVKNLKKMFGQDLRTSDIPGEPTMTIQLSPNPGNGNVNLRFESDEEVAISLKVIDITGRILSDVQLNIVKGISEMPFDFTMFPAGIYFININNKMISQHIKFIKK